MLKNQAKAKPHSEADLLLFGSHSFSSSSLSSKNDKTYSKKCAKNKCGCFNKIIWSIIMKMKIRRKNRSHKYYINRPRPWHGHTYTEYKKCPSIMVLICIKQYLSNIWSWIYEKVTQHWGRVEKSLAYKKECNGIIPLYHYITRILLVGIRSQVAFISTFQNAFRDWVIIFSQSSKVVFCSDCAFPLRWYLARTSLYHNKPYQRKTFPDKRSLKLYFVAMFRLFSLLSLFITLTQLTYFMSTKSKLLIMIIITTYNVRKYPIKRNICTKRV